MCDHPNRETAMIVTHRKPDGTPSVWCDPCIAPLVRALNDGGVPTVASCCGHRRRPGRITLRGGVDLWVDAGGQVERSLLAEAKLRNVEALVGEWDAEALQAWRDADRLHCGDVIADQVSRRAERLRGALDA